MEQTSINDHIPDSSIELHVSRISCRTFSPTGHFPFLGCPAEIRNIIYDEFFDSAIFAEQFLALTKTCRQIHTETRILAKVAAAQLPTQAFILEPCLSPKATGYSPVISNGGRPFTFDLWTEQDHVDCKLVWANFGSQNQKISADITDLTCLREVKITISNHWASSILGNTAPLEEFFSMVVKALNEKATVTDLVVKTPQTQRVDTIPAIVLALRPLRRLNGKVTVISPSSVWTRYLKNVWLNPRRSITASTAIREEFVPADLVTMCVLLRDSDIMSLVTCFVMVSIIVRT